METTNKILINQIKHLNNNITEYAKQIEELKQENKNLNWMLEKQFDESFRRMKEEKKINDKMLSLHKTLKNFVKQTKNN